MRVLPIMTALDADGNGEISDAEINGSVAALKKLDKNKDNKLTAEELRPNFGGNGAAEVAVESQIALLHLSPSR